MRDNYFFLISSLQDYVAIGFIKIFNDVVIKRTFKIIQSLKNSNEKTEKFEKLELFGIHSYDCNSNYYCQNQRATKLCSSELFAHIKDSYSEKSSFVSHF